MATTRATLTAMQVLPAGVAVAACMTARYARAHYPCLFAAAPSLYSRQFSISTSPSSTHSTDSSTRLPRVTTTAVAAAWPPFTPWIVRVATTGAAPPSGGTSSSRGFRRWGENTTTGDIVTPPEPHSPTSSTETASHPAPPWAAESEVNMEVLNEETLQAGHWGHTSVSRGITTTATAAARNIPMATGGTAAPTAPGSPASPTESSSHLAPPPPAESDADAKIIIEMLEEEMVRAGLAREIDMALLNKVRRSMLKPVDNRGESATLVSALEIIIS